MHWLEENRSGSPFYSSLSLSQVAKKKKVFMELFGGPLRTFPRQHAAPECSHFVENSTLSLATVGVTRLKSQPGAEQQRPGEGPSFPSDAFPWEVLLIVLLHLHVGESIAFDSLVTKGTGGEGNWRVLAHN